jgi:hypothetical protein
LGNKSGRDGLDLCVYSAVAAIDCVSDAESPLCSRPDVRYRSTPDL